jgi:hypothetical protein
MAFTAGGKLRASDLVALDNRGYFSRYSTSDSSTANAWKTPAIALAEGSGTGLSLASSTITLGAGTWAVDLSLYISGAGTSTGLIALAKTTGDPVTGGSYGIQEMGSTATLWGGEVSQLIKSDGTAALVPQIYETTGSLSLATLRLVFQRLSSS